LALAAKSTNIIYKLLQGLLAYKAEINGKFLKIYRQLSFKYYLTNRATVDGSRIEILEKNKPWLLLAFSFVSSPPVIALLALFSQTVYAVAALQYMQEKTIGCGYRSHSL